jgi:hypothetical protein
MSLSLFGSSYDFYEYKFVSAAGTMFKKEGKISVDGKKSTITYSKPKYKQIISDGENITIEGASGTIFKLKGKALFYTKLFIDVMIRLDNLKELQTNRDFDVKKEDNLYKLSFKGEIEDQILSAEVQTKSAKVVSFKLFMKNGDSLEIVKK